MTSRTKWASAGAVALAAIAAVWFTMRGDDAGSSAPRTAEPAADAGPRARAPAAAGQDAGEVDASPRASQGPPARFEPPRKVMSYRPAHLLIYSEEVVQQDPGKDRDSAMIQRLIEVVNANSAQAEQIRGLWGLHENGRRALWEKAYPSKSRPRPLDARQVRALDDAFQHELFDKVLDKDQQARLLEELPPPEPN